MPNNDLDALIKALQIFRKYGNPTYPTHCEHDVLYVLDKYDNIPQDDINKLEELGFSNDEEYGVYQSFRFGSS